MPGAPSSLHPLARLPEEWAGELKARGERAFLAKEIFAWIHRRGALEPGAMSSVPARLRALLEAEGLGDVCVIERIHRSDDGTRKLLVRLRDGATIETVLLPMARLGRGGAERPLRPDDVASNPTLGRGLGDAAAAALEAALDADAADEDEDEPGEPGDASGRVRVTQCISTQVGCAMGCVFCASGIAGLKRHLAPEEIVAQVLVGRALLEPGEELRNVVYMGMGEPLHNYAAVARSLRLLTHPGGIGLSTRRVTVSTSGLVPEIARLGEDFAGQIGLAISLHAADDATRSSLMPINRKHPLPSLMEALRRYPLPRRRRITIEYTLVSGKNDAIEEAHRLKKLLRGVPVKVNLIPMNPIEASSLSPPDWERVFAFQKVLCDAGYSCFVRKRRGDDVSAACGQLVLLGAKPKVKGFRPPRQSD